MITKQCEFCSKEFKTKLSTKALFCSKKCFYENTKYQNSLLTEKECPRCNQVKSLDCFYKDERAGSKTTSECKECLCKRSWPDDEEKRLKINEKSKNYYWKNKEKSSLNCKKRTKEIRDIVLKGYGGETPCCACCGENIADFLTIDHIYNNGAEDRKGKAKGWNRGSYLYRRLMKENFPEGFQLLCWNCNTSKYRNKGICAHKLLIKNNEDYLLTKHKD